MNLGVVKPVEVLQRARPAQDFTWPSVEDGGYRGEMLGGVDAQIRFASENNCRSRRFDAPMFVDCVRVPGIWLLWIP
jgi:hypothetical protein